MSDLLQFILLGSAAVYFWTVMFERFSRSCAAIGAVILIGSAGMALKPTEFEPLFGAVTMIGVISLLLGRSWLILKEWYHGD